MGTMLSDMIQLHKRNLFVVVALLAGLGTFLASCAEQSSDQRTRRASAIEDEKRSPRYEGWTTFRQENIVIHHPPQHPMVSDLSNMARGYVTALRRVSTLLGMPPFADTLIVYYYTGFGQGREMTGREYPFGDSTAVHFWLPSFPGTSLMQYLLPRWSAVSTRHRFLYHGLIALNDFSGQDYHAATMQLIDSGGFIPLAALAVDTATDSNTERLQTAESASFVAYLIGQHGVTALRQLYESSRPFEEAAPDFLGSNIETLQAEWLGYAQLQQRPQPKVPSP